MTTSVEERLARLAAELRVGSEEMEREVERMRAKCEAIARGYFYWDECADRIANDIAALKGRNDET